MKVKKGDTVRYYEYKAKISSDPLAHTRARMARLGTGSHYKVLDVTAGVFCPLVRLEGNTMWHPIDIFIIKNEKMKDLKNLEKGDKLLCINKLPDHRPAKEGQVYTFNCYAFGAEETKHRICIEEDGTYWYELEWFKLADDSTSLKEGDEVEVEKDISATINGRYTILASVGNKYHIHSVTPDRKFLTLTNSSSILPSSLFRKVKPKKTEAKITIGTGTKVAQVTVTKEVVNFYFREAFGFSNGTIEISKLQEVYNTATKIHKSPVLIQMIDEDAKVFLIGCMNADFRVSLNDIKKVLDIASKLD